MMLPDINELLKPRPKKYRNLIKHFRNDLFFSNDDSTSLTEEDLFNDLKSSRGTSLFLGTFSKKGIEFTLNKFGYFDHLKNVGLPNPVIKINTSESYKHQIQIFHEVNNQNLLSGEVVMRRSSFKTQPQGEKVYSPADLIVVEWFLLQNPLKKFSWRRPQLPGQDFPGIGFSNTVFEIFYWMTKRLKADGVVLIPNYLHTGIFYGRSFVFINPKKQGVLVAMDSMLNSTCTLNQLSWACAEGQLIDKNSDSIFYWKPSPMILPVSRIAKEYFGSKIYTDEVEQTKKLTNLKINKGYKKRFKSNLEAVK